MEAVRLGQAGPQLGALLRGNKEKVEDLGELRGFLMKVDTEMYESAFTDKVLSALSDKQTVKIFSNYQDEEVRKMILSELVNAASVNHQNIKRIIDAMEVPEVISLVNDYSGIGARTVGELFVGYAIRRYDDGLPYPTSAEIADAARLGKSEKLPLIVKEYSDHVSWMFAHGVIDEAISQREGKVIDRACEILSMPEIKILANSFVDSPAWNVAYNLRNIIFKIDDKEQLLMIAKTVGRYSGFVGSTIMFWMRIVAEGENPRENLEKACRFYDSEDLVKLLKFDQEFDSKFGSMMADAVQSISAVEKLEKMVSFLSFGLKSEFESLGASDALKAVEDGIDKLATDNESFESICIYMLSKGILPKPSLENIGNYKEISLRHFEKKYGIKRQLDMEIMAAMLGSRNRIEEFAEAINNSQDTNVKNYAIGGQQIANLNIGKEKLVEYAVISILGSRDLNMLNEAMQAIGSIVGEKTVNRAKEQFNKNHKELKNSLFGIIASGVEGYEKAYKKLVETEAEEILDVLRAADYEDLEINNAYVLRSVESKDPLSYDSRVQIACVYMPSGLDIFNYHKNSDIFLFRYDLGNTAVGSAIAYFKGGNFLIDSVEGHRVFRKEGIFEAVYQDLIVRAHEIGASRLVFGKQAANETARLFLEYVSQKNLEEMKIDFTTRTKGYLETKRNGIALSLELRK